MKRVNIGCGQTPIKGWYNYDNSSSVRLCKHHILTRILCMTGLLIENQKEFVAFARKNDINWADAAKRIPLPDNSVEVLYTSHMVEHLCRDDLKRFFKEAMRILVPNGIIRVVVPDLRKLVDQYLLDGDGNKFIESTLLTYPKSNTIVDKIKFLIVGNRHHQWMYDGPSMAVLLSSVGFVEPRILPAGATIIPDPGELNLKERADESVYLEALSS